MKISLLLPARRSAHCLAHTVRECSRFLHGEFGTDHEILIITNSAPGDADDGTDSIARNLANEVPLTRVVFHRGQVGKGAALRSGFLASRGDWIFFVDSDLPYDLEFFKQAAFHLASGADFVSGNRRMDGSEILCQTRFVGRFLRRLILGRIFNWGLRRIFGFQSTDTQAGIKAMKRSFARLAFSLQSCPGFYFDVELFLSCRNHQLIHREVPLRSNVTTDVTTVRLFTEIRRAAFWIGRIWRQNRRGFYSRSLSPLDWKQWHVSADDWGFSPAVNRGILDLARQGILRRVSVMVDAPFVKQGLDELKAIPGMELGLHFNLTYPFGHEKLQLHSPVRALRKTVWKSFFGKKSFQADVATELRRQIGRLRELGVTVSYLDGHHHIHVFPGISKAVALILKEQGIGHVRIPVDRGTAQPSRILINLLGINARHAFRNQGLHSRPFLYPSLGDFSHPERLRRKLLAHPGYEVLVHPADDDDVSTLPIPDSYSAERVTEYQALLGFVLG